MHKFYLLTYYETFLGVVTLPLTSSTAFRTHGNNNHMKWKKMPSFPLSHRRGRWRRWRIRNGTMCCCIQKKKQANAIIRITNMERCLSKWKSLSQCELCSEYIYNTYISSLIDFTIQNVFIFWVSVYMRMFRVVGRSTQFGIIQFNLDFGAECQMNEMWSELTEMELCCWAHKKSLL